MLVGWLVVCGNHTVQAKYIHISYSRSHVHQTHDDDDDTLMYMEVSSVIQLIIISRLLCGFQRYFA